MVWTSTRRTPIIPQPWLQDANVTIDPTDTRDWHDSLIRRLTVTGAMPYTVRRAFEFEHAADPSDAPPGVRLVSDSKTDGGRTYFLAGDDAVVSIVDRDRVVAVYAAATTAARRDEIDAHFGDRLRTRDKKTDPAEVVVSFTFADERGGATRVARTVQARSWGEARPYYSSRSAALLDSLMEVGPAPKGKVVLLHGPPGTGKTSALLTLARQWRRWCRVTFVLDPERLFAGQPGYAMQLALGDARVPSGAPDDRRWRLLVIEDAADLLRPTGGHGMHPGLARLLNLTDGVLGQGSRLLVCITTNEPVGTIHAALRRPGRCLADIAFEPLSRAEANRLLPPETPARGPVTLAEVLTLRGDLAVVADREQDAAGAYV